MYSIYGTHGAGKYLPNISMQLHGIRLVTGKGEVRVFNADDHPQMMQALKVSLGSMGFITEETLLRSNRRLPGTP